MSIMAYPMIEKEFEGHMWKRMGNNDSFSLSYLTIEEERFLHGINFYHWLGDECTGYTETCIDDINEYLGNLRPEERYRIKDLTHAILTDIKDNDGFYIQYNVG